MLAWIDDQTPLPPTTLALGADSDAPGLVAAGGHVTPERLEEAYARGIFPWYSPGQPVLWWSPDPRMVLKTAEFRLHRSLAKTVRRFLAEPAAGKAGQGAVGRVTIDSAFEQVIRHCARTPRDGQDGTWIVPAIVDAYTRWHRRGRVHSVETWIGNRLVGGLYFVNLGRMVFGESMFSLVSDASKIALAALVAHCRARGVAWIDCQQATGHLASLGAREVPRADFEAHLAATVTASAPDWTYDESTWATLLERPHDGAGQRPGAS
jgi:leucyl/phenylalanyl-tRNA--protein transferase